jgi:RHS repeat-associated protein
MKPLLKCVEMIIRYVLIVAFILSQFGSSAYRAQASSLILTDEPAIRNGNEQPAELPKTNQPNDYYTPPQITRPDQNSPVPDEKAPIIPANPKEEIEFIVTPDNGSIQPEDAVSINVTINNNSKGQLSDLTFSDKIEKGWQYIPENNSASFDIKNKSISASIPTIDVGQSFTFSYKLKVIDFNKLNKKGELRLRNVELSSKDGKIKLMSPVTVGVGLANIPDQSIIVSPKTEGGWYRIGKSKIYLPADVFKQNSVLIQSPISGKGKGPAYQFKLDIVGTDPINKDSLGNITDQTIGLQYPITASFTQPAFIEINMDEVGNLKTLEPGTEPFVATYDDASKVWVKIPYIKTEDDSNAVIVQTSHFSTWGAGIGNSLPQNGANVLLFNQPYASLFTGSSQFSYPIWTPPGRNGLAPSLSLSYSSGSLNGVLGDIQAPWVGMGWNMDTAEIVRKITTNPNGYGYLDQFALTFNGTIYNLLQNPNQKNRYYTKEGPFLYIERHNLAFGNAENVQNATKEWWEIISTNGTRYRLGWNTDSEQLTLMYGYKCVTGSPCTTPSGAYSSLGYAGVANDLVALRWRLDRVKDTFNNFMDYSYFEETPLPSSLIPAFDRASYLHKISFTGHLDSQGNEDLAPGYQLMIVYGDRSTDIAPTEFGIWDHFDTKFLDKIKICDYQCDSSTSRLIRQYQFTYSNSGTPNNNGTLILTGIQAQGGGYDDNSVTIPLTKSSKIGFTYNSFNNRVEVAGKEPWYYPRLISISNGYGATQSYTYENDGRSEDTWLNYRIKTVMINDGLGISNSVSYEYQNPKYEDTEAKKELIGFADVSETIKDPSNGNAINITAYKYGVVDPDKGKELFHDIKDHIGGVDQEITYNYVSDNSMAPFAGWEYHYLSEQGEYKKVNGNLVLVKKTYFQRDPSNGNLLTQLDYIGSNLYRKNNYSYIVNTSPEYYILDRVSRSYATDANNTVIADQRYFYDHGNPILMTGALTLTQVLTGSGSQTNDTSYEYDSFGNINSITKYRNTGTVNQSPISSDNDQVTTSTYDETYQTYPIITTNALNYSTQSEYLTTLGVVSSVEDPNGFITSTQYDGLGRITSIYAPGIENNPTVTYTYPIVNEDGNIPSPYAIHMQIWDELNPTNRNVWGIYDGLSKVLQQQVEDASISQLLITAQQYDNLGMVSKQSIPYYSTGSGGSNIPVDWNAVLHTSTAYDDFGRITQVISPDNLVATTSYDGLEITTTDPSNHLKRQKLDGLGRVTSVQEFSGEGSGASVYSTTNYQYDSNGRIVKVIDNKNNQTQISYNWLGQKIQMIDPDMGKWIYQYDTFGNLVSQTDANNQRLGFGFDKLNRLTVKNDISHNIELATYDYGDTKPEIGFRKEMNDLSGLTTWNYSNYGRTVEETREIDHNSYTLTTTSDWLGRVSSITYPDNEIVNYQYDALGRASGMDGSTIGPIASLGYNTLSQVETLNLGNNTVIQNCYDSTSSRLISRRAYTGSTQSCTVQHPDDSLMYFGYGYDNSGNITTLVDSKKGEQFKFTYDDLNRLILAEGTSNSAFMAYRQAYQYDSIGNILQISQFNDDPATAGMYEENYSGNWIQGAWSTVSDQNASGGTLIQSGSNQSTMRMSFSGGGFSYKYASGPDQGIANIKIDGTLVATEDHYAETPQMQSTTTYLTTNGKHWIEIGSSDSKNPLSSNSIIAIDSISVLPTNIESTSTQVSSTPTMDSTQFATETLTVSITETPTPTETPTIPITETPTPSETPPTPGQGSVIKQSRNVVPVVYIVKNYLYQEDVTETPTFTLTPTITNTPSETLIPSDTNTSIPTETSTDTITPSLTNTFTPSNTATITKTPSITPTATASPYVAGEWRFDTLIATQKVGDSSGNGSVCFLNTGTLTSNGISGSALNFNATAKYAYMPIGTPYALTFQNSFSISAWINPSQVGTIQRNIINRGTNGFEYGLWTDANGYLEFHIGKLSPNKVTGPIPPVNKWTHVVGVYDRSEGMIKLFVNGIEVAAKYINYPTVGTGTSTPTKSPTPVDGIVVFSDNSGNKYSWLGMIDEVRIYNGALTPSQVEDLYQLFPTPEPTSTGTLQYSLTPTITPTPTKTSTNIIPTMTAVPGLWGTGLDGNGSVPAGTTVNLNVDSISGRSCADAISFSVISLTSNSATLNSNPSGYLSVGDEIILTNLQGYASNSTNVGNYEFFRVLNVTDTGVTFNSNKMKFYGDGINDDSNIGINTTQQKVIIQRVPNYQNLTVNGTLTSSSWNGVIGGMLVFRVHGEFTGAGTGIISLGNKGYRGAYGGGAQGHNGLPGEGINGGVTGTIGGGGGGQLSGGSGGGGNYGGSATAGGNHAGVGGVAGSAYGDQTIDKLFLGAGGGGSAALSNNPSNGGMGGNGGGILFAIARNIDFAGAIENDGSEGAAGSLSTIDGGSGAGGSIKILSESAHLYSISAKGGPVHVNGGLGGFGRIAIDSPSDLSYFNSIPTPYTFPTNQQINSKWGTGNDGDVTITGSVNLNTQNKIANRTCNDGGDAVNYSVTGINNGKITLASAPQQGCLEIGDEVLLINLQGISDHYENVGKYEFLTIVGILGNTVTLASDTINYYGDDETNNNIGTASTNQRVMLQRVPNYNNLTNNGTLVSSAWNGVKNGVFAIRVRGTLSGSGSISMNSLGYLYGYGAGSRYHDGYQGESYKGLGAPAITASNGGGGGGGLCSGGQGGSSSYGTQGASGNSGSKGDVYGDAGLPRLYLGSGGGGGGALYNWSSTGGRGGNGGGIALIMANTISYDGSIESRGQTSLAGTKEGVTGSAGKGGAGSGGSILILGDTITINSLNATGGATFITGGSGRIAVYYDTSSNITSSDPVPYTQNILTPTPEVTPTESVSPTPNPGWVAKDYSYSTSQPHAVASLSTGESYTYDANGNMISRSEKGIDWTQSYNVENRLASMGNGTDTWEFIYDGDGNKVKQINPDGSVSLFLYGGLVTMEDTAMTSYYSIAGIQVGYKNSDGMNYLLIDHQGSVIGVMDSSAVLQEEVRYLPFGSVRGEIGILGTDLEYTGQRALQFTGLMDYKARFYDTDLGRFTQPDTIVPGVGDPQGWNRFSYVKNNPIVRIDPSGNRPCWAGNNYRCNLSGDEIRRLSHSGNQSVIDFINNYMTKHNIMAIFACGMGTDANCGSNDNYKDYGGRQPLSYYADNLNDNNKQYFGYESGEGIDNYISRISEFLEKNSDKSFLLMGHSLGADVLLAVASSASDKGVKIRGLMLFDPGAREGNMVNKEFISDLNNKDVPIFTYTSRDYGMKGFFGLFILPLPTTIYTRLNHTELAVSGSVYIETLTSFYSLILER